MVDLPAPFWPISAWTSPTATSSVAALKAGMPPNALLIARIDRRGDAVASVAAIDLSFLHTNARPSPALRDLNQDRLKKHKRLRVHEPWGRVRFPSPALAGEGGAVGRRK